MDSIKIRIYNFFGKLRQRAKLREELYEIAEAYQAYDYNHTEENLLHLIEELNDALNVAEGIALVEHGITEKETRAGKHSKLYRTVNIIDKCKTPDDYDNLRG